jgi:hypothetical protein
MKHTPVSAPAHTSGDRVHSQRGDGPTNSIMDSGCPVEDLPLMDPERDVVALPGTRGAALAGTIRRAHDQVLARIRAEHALAFSQKLFRVLPALSVLHPLVEPVLRRRVGIAVGCLEQVVREYPKNAELRDFLHVPPVLHRWIMRHEQPERLTIDFCRLDLLGDRLGNTRILEFNPSSPGLVISSGMAGDARGRQSPLGVAGTGELVRAGRLVRRLAARLRQGQGCHRRRRPARRHLPHAGQEQELAGPVPDDSAAASPWTHTGDMRTQRYVLR